MGLGVAWVGAREYEVWVGCGQGFEWVWVGWIVCLVKLGVTTHCFD